jgi:hypothetical protein
MKKTAIFTVSVLLFCGGLFCLHLTAQTGKTENTASTAALIPLLDPKIEECSERELLELKVAACRKFTDAVTALYNAGAPSGAFVRLIDAHVDLAAAEIEFYRHTGEQNKLRIALKARVEALSDKLRAVTLRNEVTAVYEAEVQLLNALLEQNQTIKTAD